METAAGSPGPRGTSQGCSLSVKWGGGQGHGGGAVAGNLGGARAVGTPEPRGCSSCHFALVPGTIHTQPRGCPCDPCDRGIIIPGKTGAPGAKATWAIGEPRISPQSRAQWAVHGDGTGAGGAAAGPRKGTWQGPGRSKGCSGNEGRGQLSPHTHRVWRPGWEGARPRTSPQGWGHPGRRAGREGRPGS